MSNKIKTILSRWRSHSNIAENIVEWRTIAAKPAETSPFPNTLAPQLRAWLTAQGIYALYSHQRIAYEKVSSGANVAIISGTASGKTLCYNLPVIDSLIKQPEGKALYLFPTKALAQDQLTVLEYNGPSGGSTGDGACFYL